MSSGDDAAYRRSVRNMSLVLASIVITIFAAIFVPPYLLPTRENFQESVSLDSPFGFTLHLEVNTTAPSATGHVLITGWVNSTSASIENVTSVDSWGVPQDELWGQDCTAPAGWPIGLGVMRGHYTQDNYTLGSLLPLPHPLCLVAATGPGYFLFEPHSSRTLVDIGGVPHYWVIQTSYSFGYATGEALPEGGGPNQLPKGVYTVLLADEWGDVLTTNLVVT